MSGTLLIRADASSSLGVGHVMRMVALSDAWQAEGGTTVMVGSFPEGLVPRLLSRGIKLESAVLGTPDQEGKFVDALARRVAAKAVVADGYGFPLEFQRAVTSTRLLVVDDNGENNVYDCDGVLNVNVHARFDMYSRRSGREQLLLGSAYTLLRREVLGAPRRVAPNFPILKLLLTFGGADPANATGLLLEALQAMNWSGETRVIIGAANRRREALEAYGANHGVEMLSNVSDMTSPMRWADLCVCTPSTTFWELAWVGTPALLVSLADNQVDLGKRLEELGCSLVLGDARGMAPRLAADRLSACIGNEDLLGGLHGAALQICDGLGAVRVVRFLKTGRL